MADDTDTTYESASLSEKTHKMLDRAIATAHQLVDGEHDLPARPQGWSDVGVHIGLQGHTIDQVVEAVGRAVSQTPSSAAPRFLNQLFGGRDPAATFAEILATLPNTSMYTFKVAGPQILIEQEIVARMAAKVGFDDGDGILAPGGSLANMTAMIVARNEAFPGVRESGLGGAQLTVYTSAAGHYSIRKNAGIIGLGRNNVRQVPTDDRGRMNVADLRAMIAEDRAGGAIPVMINATAGTTVLGVFDPIREIAEVAADEQIWMHIDGALGGSALMSTTHRHLLDGSKLADSFTWNAHKMMGVPLPCSVILIKERGLLAKHFSETATYLFQADGDELNPGTRSIQCGRRNDALKLWSSWLYHGDSGYEVRIDRLFELARYAASRIDADPQLDLLAEPESINVCFEVKGHASAELCRRLDSERRLKIGYGEVAGRQAIRLVCVNPDLELHDIDDALNEIKACASNRR